MDCSKWADASSQSSALAFIASIANLADIFNIRLPGFEILFELRNRLGAADLV
jgi:hypothetical protein